MGIVAKQTSLNVLIIGIAFAIGGLNTLVFYPLFLSAEEYGLVVFLLATSNLLMPLIGFGVHQTIIRFFSSYKTKEEQQLFMSSVILLPLFIALIVGGFGVLFYHSISIALSIQNPVIANYTWLIFVVAVATAYFEVFYAWARVQLQSVAGNVLKRDISSTLSLFSFDGFILFDLSFHDFVVALVSGYYLRLLVDDCIGQSLLSHSYSFAFSVQYSIDFNLFGYDFVGSFSGQFDYRY